MGTGGLLLRSTATVGLHRRASALNSFEAGPTAALPVDAGALFLRGVLGGCCVLSNRAAVQSPGNCLHKVLGYAELKTSVEDVKK